MNVFRVLGDVSHTLSKCILIWAIHSNKSAEGKHLYSSIPQRFTVDGRVRCVTDHADALRCSLPHSLPRSVLGVAGNLVLEFRPQEFLHIFVALYHLTHDESLRAYQGT